MTFNLLVRNIHKRTKISERSVRRILNEANDVIIDMILNNNSDVHIGKVGSLKTFFRKKDRKIKLKGKEFLLKKGYIFVRFVPSSKFRAMIKYYNEE